MQWYPGHMTKARRAMEEAFPSQDVIIEVLDARMPAASANPVITELRRHKPCLKVLSKSDLADPNVTLAWVRALESDTVGVYMARSDRAAETRAKVVEGCKKLVAHPSGIGKTVRAIVCGIPNVGKSTLINTLMERKVAKTGDEPAVTKSQQQVVLKNGMTLRDSPGIMWPKIEDEDASYRLAFGGAIPDSALDYEQVAMFGAAYLLLAYPELLMTRYKMKELPPNAHELIEEIGRRRGCLKSGGVIDRHKASDHLLHDFRTGALGRISLERPIYDLPVTA